MIKRYFVISIGVVIIATILSWLFSDLVREVLIIPVSYLLWISRMIYESFNQQAMWISFIIVVFIIMLFSITPIKTMRARRRHKKNKSTAQVAKWAKRLKDIDRGEYLKWRLAQHLVNLTFEALSYQRGKTTEQVTEEVLAGKLHLTPEINAYLRAARDSNQLPSSQNNIFKSKEPTPLDLEIDHLITYLEKILNS